MGHFRVHLGPTDSVKVLEILVIMSFLECFYFFPMGKFKHHFGELSWSLYPSSPGPRPADQA